MFIIINEYNGDYGIFDTLDEVKKFLKNEARESMELDSFRREYTMATFTVYEIKREFNVEFSIDVDLVEVEK